MINWNIEEELTICQWLDYKKTLYNTVSHRSEQFRNDQLNIACDCEIKQLRDWLTEIRIRKFSYSDWSRYWTRLTLLLLFTAKRALLCAKADFISFLQKLHALRVLSSFDYKEKKLSAIPLCRQHYSVSLQVFLLICASSFHSLDLENPWNTSNRTVYGSGTLSMERAPSH